MKEYMKNWRKTSVGKTSIAKNHAKRERNLGFEPINEPFPGSVGHHTDKVRVIYITKELHESIWHSQVTGQGMEEMNDLAIEFMLAELGEC